MTELLTLSEMTQQERDEYLVYASAKILRRSGLDMPDNVAESFFFYSEKTPGYEIELLDTVFNCLAYTLNPRALSDKDHLAIMEMLTVDTNDEEVIHAIIMELMTYSKYASIGKAPKPETSV